MKDSQILILILALIIYQTASAQTHNPKDPVSQKSAAADQSWQPFFRKLRAAVTRRDRTTLKGLMAPEFHYTSGHHARSQQNDWREGAFRYWDDPQINGWEALDRTLAKGAVPKAAWWGAGRKDKMAASRVAPPEANIRRNIDRGLVSWVAQFEFHNGHWYFTSFDQCCD